MLVALVRVQALALALGNLLEKSPLLMLMALGSALELAASVALAPVLESNSLDAI